MQYLNCIRTIYKTLIIKTITSKSLSAVYKKYDTTQLLKYRNKINIAVLLFIVLINLKLMAQNIQKKDYSYYLSQAIKFSYNNNDSLIFYSKKMQLSLVECEKIKGLLHEARGYYQKSNHNKSQQIVLTALNQLNGRNKNKVCIKESFVDSYRRLFYISLNAEKYDDALDYLQKRKKVVETFPKSEGYYRKNSIDINNGKATLKMRIGSHTEALKILKDSFNEINKIELVNPNSQVSNNFILQKANILNNIGNTFVDINDKEYNLTYLDSASYYYKRAYNTVKKKDNFSSENESQYQMSIIRILIKKKDYSSALFYLNRYDSIFKKSNQHIFNLYYYKSIAHRFLKNHDSAIYFSKQHLKHHTRLKKYNKKAIPVYDNLANSFLAKKMHDSALKYSNLTLIKLKKIETDKKNLSIKIHNQELNEYKLLNDRLKKKNSDSNLFKYVILIIFILLILVFIIINSRKKGKKNIVIEPQGSQKKQLDQKLTNEILEGISKFEETTLFLNNEFNINSLAKVLNTNTTYLSIVINNHKKLTYKQYASKLRINHAINKIKTDKKFANYTIDAIAKEVGYTNASAFTRVFKKQQGTTPSEFIRLNKSKTS